MENPIPGMNHHIKPMKVAMNQDVCVFWQGTVPRALRKRDPHFAPKMFPITDCSEGFLQGICQLQGGAALLTGHCGIELYISCWMTI